MKDKPLSPEQTNRLIRERRAIYPRSYNSKPVDKSIIQDMLENANWAPTHRMTEPWRFKVYSGKALERLGDFMANYYKLHTPKEKFSEHKYQKNAKKPRQSAYVIAICMKRDPAECVPEFEEVAAVACAVQNMWLTAWANDLGAYWSTPGSIHSEEMKGFLNLEEGEKCLGFFYVGRHDLPYFPSKRGPIEEKVDWVEE